VFRSGVCGVRSGVRVGFGFGWIFSPHMLLNIYNTVDPSTYIILDPIPSPILLPLLLPFNPIPVSVTMFIPIPIPLPLPFQ